MTLPLKGRERKRLLERRGGRAVMILAAIMNIIPVRREGMDIFKMASAVNTRHEIVNASWGSTITCHERLNHFI